MKSVKSLKIINLILALFLLIFTVGYTFAWFTDKNTVGLDFDVETSGYFAEGDGSSTSPFIITSPVHLYNVAYLQNLGRLQNTDDNGVDNGYYFRMSNDLDMRNTVIPPIGNETYPFIGNFNGLGYKISNLKVSTAFDDLTSLAVDRDTYAFSRSVGLFGKASAGSTIANFILDNPIVKAAEESQTRYVSSTASATVAGLAAGYLDTSNNNGTRMYNVGVNGGKLIINNLGYKTYNSIIGATTSTSAGTEQPDNTISDTGYFIGDELRAKIGTTSAILPFLLESSSQTRMQAASLLLGSHWRANQTPTSTSLGLGAFAVTAHYSNAGGVRINRGNNIAVTESTSITYYTPTIENGNVSYTSTTAAFNTLSQDFPLSDGSTPTGFTNYFQINNSPTIKEDGISAGKDFSVYDDSNVSDINVIGTSTLKIQDANIKVIIQSAEVDNPAYITIISNPGNSARTLLLTQTLNGTEALENYDEPYLYFTDNPENISTVVASTALPANTYTAQKYAITEKGIYSLTTASSGIRILYLSVSGVAGSSSTETVTGVSNVDFLYDSVALTATDNNYSFTVGTDPYEPSAVIISFEVGTLSDGATYVLYFDRRLATPVVFNVYYTADTAPSTRGNPDGTATTTQTNVSATDWEIPTSF